MYVLLNRMSSLDENLASFHDVNVRLEVVDVAGLDTMCDPHALHIEDVDNVGGSGNVGNAGHLTWCQVASSEVIWLVARS